MMLENPKNRVIRAKDGLQSSDYDIRKMVAEYIRYLGVAIQREFVLGANCLRCNRHHVDNLRTPLGVCL